MHPDLRKRIMVLIDSLHKDPFNPKNKTHKLSGSLRGQYAVSINWKYRISFIIFGTIITLVDVGSHDDLY